MTTPPAPEQADRVAAGCDPPYPAINLSGPEFRGPGAHRIILVNVVTRTGRSAFGRRVQTSRKLVVPDSWYARNDILVEDDDDAAVKARAQLLVCVTPRPDARPSSRVVTCPFERRSIDFPLVEGSYGVSVREARTGIEVGTFTVPGTGSDKDSCPAAVLHRSGDTLLRGIDGSSFQRQLAPYVNDPR